MRKRKSRGLGSPAAPATAPVPAPVAPPPPGGGDAGGAQTPAPDDTADTPAPETAETPDAAGGDQPEGEGGGWGGQAPNANPEEQKEYERFVAVAKMIIFGPKTADAFVARLRAGVQAGDPIGALATAAVVVVKRIDDQTNHQVDGDILQQAGTEVIEELSQLASSAKVHDYTDEEKQGAFYRGMDLYQQQMKKEGRVNPQQAKQDLGQLQQASNAGKLDDLAKAVGGKTPAPGGPAPDGGGAPRRPQGLGGTMKEAA